MGYKKVLFVVHNQFGYQTDYFHYCYYLKNDYEISYICFDQGKKKISIDCVNVIYLSKQKNILFSIVDFIYSVIKQAKALNPDLVYIKYFPLCSLLGILNNGKRIKMVLDYRTGSVTNSAVLNALSNFVLFAEQFGFRKRSILSEILAKKLRIYNSHTLPLGADTFCSEDKHFDSLYLLYVGTLTNRNIEDTIVGLKMFINSNPDINLKYYIIGGGSKGCVTTLKESIARLELENVVDYIGPVIYSDLGYYFHKCNIGVSYVPVTPYYDKQHPTKTYEYLLSGMPVVATSTTANAQIIKGKTGVLIESNPKSFCKGLEEVLLDKTHYSSKFIRESYMNFLWSNIVSRNLKPFIEGIINEK